MLGAYKVMKKLAISISLDRGYLGCIWPKLHEAAAACFASRCTF